MKTNTSKKYYTNKDIKRMLKLNMEIIIYNNHIYNISHLNYNNCNLYSTILSHFGKDITHYLNHYQKQILTPSHYIPLRTKK